MYRVIAKKEIAPQVWRMELEAPWIAQAHKPGQFVLVQTDVVWGERIPLTIAKSNPETGAITLVFQTLGAGTKRLAAVEVGAGVEAVLGPLGQPTHLHERRNVVCVGGGIGAAPLLPIAAGFRQAGARVRAVLGARNKDLLILQDDFAEAADETLICTDDGSFGRHGFVTTVLEELLAAGGVDEVVAIGPAPMMRACVAVAKKYQAPITVSLNAIMVDGTGMCGGCRVTVGGQTRFVCVDGPEFDGAEVDFDNLIQRLGTYKAQEAEHNCRLNP